MKRYKVFMYEANIPRQKIIGVHLGECPKTDFVPKPYFYMGTPLKNRYRAFCSKKKSFVFQKNEGPRTLLYT